MKTSAGCYAIKEVGQRDALRIRLDTTALADAWLAWPLGNPPDSSWRWAPTGQDGLELQWSGADSGMLYTLLRHTAGFDGRAVHYSAIGSTETRPAVASLIECG